MCVREASHVPRSLHVLCTSSRWAHEQEGNETALRDIPSTNGYRRCAVPGETRTRSIVYEHGVRFEQDCSEPHPQLLRRVRRGRLKLGLGALGINGGSRGFSVICCETALSHLVPSCFLAIYQVRGYGLVFAICFSVPSCAHLVEAAGTKAATVYTNFR